MKHILNDLEITPKNRTEIGLISDFTNNPNILELSTDKIVLEREAMQIVKNHLQNAGFFEGIPYRIETGTGQSIEMYVDLTDGYIEKDNSIEVTIKRRKGLDNFKENADGTSFELMKTKGVNFEETIVFYYVITDRQFETAVTLALATYVMVEQSIKAGQELVESVTDLIEASTPIIGLSLTGIPTISFNYGAIVSASLKAIFRLLLFAILLVAIIQLALKLFVLIFPIRRKGKGVKIQELLKKGCEHLGYSFESTIFDTYPNYTILPVPLIRDRKSFIQILPDEILPAWQKGYPTSSDTTPTLGTLIDAVETMFNAKTRVLNGVVKIERRDYWENLAQNQIQIALNVQNERTNKIRFNTEEIWKRYYIKYQLDQSDLFTLDEWNYDIHDSEYSTEPLNVTNADLLTIKGLQEVNIPFSLGARKGDLNWFELTGKALFQFIDVITGLFGGGTNYGSQIENRKGYLTVSQNFWSVTKLLWVTNNKQPVNYAEYLGAFKLWDKFHYINDIRENSFQVFEQAPARMNDSEFLQIQNNNFINFDGVECEILKIEYFDETSTANITFQKRNNYAQGKVTIKRIN